MQSVKQGQGLTVTGYESTANPVPPGLLRPVQRLVSGAQNLGGRRALAVRLGDADAPGPGRRLVGRAQVAQLGSALGFFRPILAAHRHLVAAMSARIFSM